MMASHDECRWMVLSRGVDFVGHQESVQRVAKRRAEGCSMMNSRKDDGALATVANLEQRKLRNLAHDGEM